MSFPSRPQAVLPPEGSFRSSPAILMERQELEGETLSNLDLYQASLVRRGVPVLLVSPSFMLPLISSGLLIAII